MSQFHFKRQEIPASCDGDQHNFLVSGNRLTSRNWSFLLRCLLGPIAREQESFPFFIRTFVLLGDSWRFCSRRQSPGATAQNPVNPDASGQFSRISTAQIGISQSIYPYCLYDAEQSPGD